MKESYQAPHPWKVSVAEAIAIQERMRYSVEGQDRFGSLANVAGIDTGFEEGGRLTRAAIVLLSLPDFDYLESVAFRQETTFPYVPGLLSFREAPAVLEALKTLQQKPDLLLCDGQGFAHPRRFGLACHIGVITGIPSIGVAKSVLIGEHAPIGGQRGDWQPLTHAGEIIGAVLRTRVEAKPIIISIGHRIGLFSAVEMVMKCTPKYRIPEPLRRAHQLASQR